jgi:hypothetical protein
MEQAQEKNLKTPPDPGKENRNLRAGSETVPGPDVVLAKMVLR